MVILNNVKRFVHFLETDNNEEVKITKILRPLSKDLRVLDVGCGLGKKYQLLESIGFSRIMGVEKNSALLKANVEQGRNVVDSEEFFTDYRDSEFDLIIMSHLIEHFQWDELNAFMERYLDFLCDGGCILIISPVYHAYFYGDFDHVKPYLPSAIQGFYGAQEQVQVYPKHRLTLVDLSFRRAPFALVFCRSLHIQGTNKLPRLVNFFLALLFRLSFRAIGKTTGWIGLFKKLEVGSRSA